MSRQKKIFSGYQGTKARSIEMHSAPSPGTRPGSPVQGTGVPLLQPLQPHHLGCPLRCPLGCSGPDLGPASWNSHYLIFLLWTVSGWATVLRRPIRGRVDKWFSQSIISTKAKDKVGLVDLLMTLSGLSIPTLNYFSIEGELFFHAARQQHTRGNSRWDLFLLQRAPS